MILRREADGVERVSWVNVAKLLPGRNSMQCRDRYINYLSKEITKEPWTPQEDKIILEKYKQFGKRWVEIAKHLPGRSGNNVKNRWYKYLAISTNRNKVYTQLKEKPIKMRGERKTKKRVEKVIKKEEAKKDVEVKQPDTSFDNSMMFVSKMFDFPDPMFPEELLTWCFL